MVASILYESSGKILAVRKDSSLRAALLSPEYADRDDLEYGLIYKMPQEAVNLGTVELLKRLRIKSRYANGTVEVELAKTT